MGFFGDAKPHWKTMTPQWFRVKMKLILDGASRDELPESQVDLKEELGIRVHLRNPVVEREVVWNADECAFEIAFDTQGLSSKQATDMASEELLEFSAVLVRQMKRIRVEPVNTQPA
ncbi:MAG: hypothetical protein ACT4QE_00175 [Anaerolineales bacterium]